MTDIVDAKTRSRMMAGIRSKDTKPEMVVRRLLHSRGFRYRLHVNDLPGRPDIVLPKHRAVILIHGCFWHGHDCPLFRWPKSRTAYWTSKIETNRQRDAEAIDALQQMGWRICVLWECGIRRFRQQPEVLAEILVEWLTGDTSFIEERA